MAAQWAEIQAQAKQHWGQLPTERFEELERSRDWLVCLLQLLHGMTPDEAERAVDKWIAPATPARSWRPWQRG